jgi:N-acetylmuramate 1-kinase
LSDQRLAALSAWATQVLRDSHCRIRSASADASFRRYFRITTGDSRTFIAMDAPPGKEDIQPFVRIARRFRSLGLNVPEVVAEDAVQGFLLLSDLGDRHYLSALDGTTAGSLYRDAIVALVRLQAKGDDPSFLPLYDAEVLRREMELFREWYLARHLGLVLSARQNAALDEVYARLIDSALEQPKVWVHRDYHSRNLMVTDKGNPGVLDFQDAMHGPITYDLVSLLKDCYVAWPRAQIADWVDLYLSLARAEGLPVSDSARFTRWFDWMGAQRHLKAAGIFARLNHRDGKPGYLNDIPRTLGYVVDVASRYPELAALQVLLEECRAASLPLPKEMA